MLPLFSLKTEISQTQRVKRLILYENHLFSFSVESGVRCSLNPMRPLNVNEDLNIFDPTGTVKTALERKTL